MIIQEIIAIAGKPGLYRILATNRNSLVVETMPKGKRFSIPGTSRVSSLGDITMYTTGEDIHIKEVLDRMFEFTKGEVGVNHKTGPADIRAFMDEIAPELDHERVYNSDLKKLVQWFNVLVANDAFPLETEADIEKKDEEEAAASKKPAAKKKPAAAAKAPKKVTTEKAPKKPAAKKKKPAAATKAKKEA